MTRLLSHCSCIHGMASPSKSSSCRTRTESAPQSKCSAESGLATQDVSRWLENAKETQAASSFYLMELRLEMDGRSEQWRRALDRMMMMMMND